MTVKCYIVVDKTTKQVKGTQCFRSKSTKPAPVSDNFDYIECTMAEMQAADSALGEAATCCGTVTREGGKLVKNFPTDYVMMDCEKSMLMPTESVTLTFTGSDKTEKTITVNGQTISFTGSTDIVISYG